MASMAAPLRLADLLASVSLLSDLGFALPPEESMRSTIVATAIARRLGLDEATVSDAFYTTLIQHLGCTGFAHEASAVYEDEMVLNAAVARVDTNDIADVVNTLIRSTTRGRGPVDWVRVALATIVGGQRFGRMFATARCEVDRETARRLGLPERVRRALHESAEAWNGRGGVQGLGGEDISVAARIAAVAATVARFDAIGGPAAAAEVVRRRAGGELDPAICAAFSTHADEILAEAHAGDPREALLVAEPAPTRVVTEAELPAVVAAIGDVADLKSTYTLGHAAGVARLSDEVAGTLGLDPAARLRLRIAAHLHDVGRVGISAATWDKRGALSAADWEQVRLHPYHSERIMARSSILQPMAVVAGMHHERLDGSGYHRGSRGREIPIEARILAVADAFQAMTQERPHRTALGTAEAADALGNEARDGRLDPDAVAALMAATGVASTPVVRGAAPAGLSDREVEVLRLVARGLSNREIARRLVVSPRTAEHHVQHIYAKIGVSSRAAAALFAMEHDLVG
jgi:HD-GYP domain-containing protein (c-di-GMP phosphodiesterase class II)